MRLKVALAAAFIALPLAAEDEAKKEPVKSGCQVGEGLPKFHVVPVTGKFEKSGGVCYI